MSHFDQPTSIVRLTGVLNESAEHVVELARGPRLLIPVLTSGSSGLWASLLAEPDTFVLTHSGDLHRLDVLPADCRPVGSGIAARTVWIGCEDGRLVRVDEATRRPVATTRVGSLLSDLAVGAGAVGRQTRSKTWRGGSTPRRGERPARSPSGSGRRGSRSASDRCGSRIATAALCRGSNPRRTALSPRSASGATWRRSRSGTGGFGSPFRATPH
jgi:hypothetical protein